MNHNLFNILVFFPVFATTNYIKKKFLHIFHGAFVSTDRFLQFVNAGSKEIYIFFLIFIEPTKQLSEKAETPHISTSNV